MSESTKEPFLDLPEEQAASPEMLDSQVQRAQEQLLQLKRQQELIEKLSRTLVVIERETYEAEKRVEQLKATNANFADHLESLESINPKTWSNADLHKELSKALSAVDEARADYTKSLTKINAKADAEVIDPSPVVEESYFRSSDDANFLLWLKRGFAFTLPLFILGLGALLVFYFVHG